MSAQRSLRRTVLAMTVFGVMGAAFAPDAAAACFGAPQAKGRSTVAASIAPRQTEAQAMQASAAARVSVVGLWVTEFLLGDGPDIYDQMFQQYHEGGTEASLSNGLPPVLGNVCLGIWQVTGPRTIAVKHVAWNWNLDGSRAGTFVLQFTVTLGAAGSAFEGSWSAKNYDVAGNHIPELDAEGVVLGTRITID